MIDQQPAPPFAWTRESWGTALRSAPLAVVATHLFTTRDLPLRGAGSEEGWRRLAATVGVSPARLVRLKQVHGTAVVVAHANSDATTADGGQDLRHAGGDDDGRPRADIVMTNDPSLAVAVQVADCVPLLLADPVSGAVAAVHAGWRGTAAGVVGRAVRAMASHFGTRPADLSAAIGPSIGPCCYQVGGDVIEAFRAAGFPERQVGEWFRAEAGMTGKYRLDVPKANIDQLRDAGLESANIAACGLCTACHPSLFHSYRRDGAGTGRLAGVIRPRQR